MKSRIDSTRTETTEEKSESAVAKTREWLQFQINNSTPSRNSAALCKHFTMTYLSMRVVLVLLALTMPFVLTLYGSIRHDLVYQSSMSAYFWAANSDQCATFPMRTIFVGYLFAVGALLYAYKGVTMLENTFLNAAALCAFTIAVYPESINTSSNDPRILQLFANCPAIKVWAELPQQSVHFIAAYMLFGFLALVALFCADKSLKYLPPDKNSNVFLWGYRALGGLMIVFPLIGYALAFLFDALPNKVFYIEAAGVVVFGVYWAVKTWEFSLSSIQNDLAKAVQNETQRLFSGVSDVQGTDGQ